MTTTLLGTGRESSLNPIGQFYFHASEAPDNLALVSQRLSLNYRQLKGLAQQTARKLSQQGIGPGDVVGVKCQPEVTIVIWLALMQLGATSLHVTSNTILAISQYLDFVVVDDSFARIAHKNLITLTPNFLESLDATRPLEDIAELDQESLIRVVFSSGTTGKPKGVPFTVQTFLARVDSARRNWIPIQPFMSLLGPETVSGFQSIFAQLFAGETCFVSHDGTKDWELIQRYGIKSIKTSPAKLADLVRSRPSAEIEVKSDSALEVIQVAGSLLSKSLAAHCQETLHVIPTYLYGSTEVGTVSRGEFNPQFPNWVGKISSEIECEIVDEQNKQVDYGIVGLVRIRRNPIPSGYWKDPQLSNNGFRDGWFYPGDRGRISSSKELFIEGRTDDLINAGGAKVNLAQIDQTLSDLGKLSDVATFEFMGPLGESLIGLAYTSDKAIRPEEVEQLVKLAAPTLKINAFLRLDSIPRNSLGKVQRDALAQTIDRN